MKKAEGERPEKKRRRAASESEGGSERPKRSKASEGGAGTKVRESVGESKDNMKGRRDAEMSDRSVGTAVKHRCRRQPCLVRRWQLLPGRRFCYSELAATGQKRSMRDGLPPC